MDGVEASKESREIGPKESNHQPSGNVDCVEVLDMTGEIVPKKKHKYLLFFSFISPYTYTLFTPGMPLEFSQALYTST